MMDAQTVGEAFIAYLESLEVGVFGTDLFLGEVPAKAKDDVMWVVTSGGLPEVLTPGGGMIKAYTFDINYRSTSGKKLERTLFALEEIMNCTACVNLVGFETIGISATQFASDADIDDESRRIGLLQVTIRLYKRKETPIVS